MRMIEVTKGKQKKIKETKEEEKLLVICSLVQVDSVGMQQERWFYLFIYFLLIRKVITINDYNAW